jgi:hypothetical protein
MVLVINATKKKKLCDAEVANTFLRRALGLMFRKPRKKQGLLIEFSPHFSSRTIHSCFMRFPVDLIFIGRDKRVTELKTLHPWRFYAPRRDCRWVLELPQGVIKEKIVEPGDRLDFQHAHGPG